jgi:hypothetical protein
VLERRVERDYFIIIFPPCPAVITGKGIKHEKGRFV